MTSNAQNRRESDLMADLLKQQIAQVGTKAEHTEEMLQKHVTECTALQKKGFGILVFLAGWTVAHSPEGLTVILKAIRAVGL